MIIFFNIVLFAIAVFATLVVRRYRAELRLVDAIPGAVLILLGIWIRTMYSLVDLLTVIGPEVLGDEQQQEQFIEAIHSYVEWPTNALFVFLVVAGLTLMVIRISQQLRKKEELARSEVLQQERLNQAAEIARLGYYLYNPRSKRIEFCTEIHAENHGLPLAAYIAKGRTLSNDLPLIHPDDREMIREKYVEVHAGRTIDVEYRVPTPQGIKRIREITQPVFDDDGTVLYEMGTSQDVTEQYDLKQQIAQSQKMEAIGQLTGGVAHDFNNLLAVILGNLELIEESDDPDEISACLKAAMTATHRGADLTKSLLSFARQSRLEPAAIDVNQMVRETKNWSSRVIPENIDVEISLLAGLWWANADPGLTQNALLNLILNAQDAMPLGGKMTIETSNVRIDEEYNELRGEDVEPGRYVMLAVSDTGEGIPEENLTHIFDPFFTTKPVGTGSGLGLSMVQGFLKQSGGTVRVYTEEGVGTTFKLYFKAFGGAHNEPVREELEVQQSPEAGARVLVVEDEDAVLKVLTETLKKAGYHINSARSGDEAMRMWDDGLRCDLLVTDIVMPGELQGTHLAQALRERHPDLPALFLSGYASEATVHGNGLRPEDIRLMKPVRRADLLAAVEKALRVGNCHP